VKIYEVYVKITLDEINKQENNNKKLKYLNELVERKHL